MTNSEGLMNLQWSLSQMKLKKVSVGVYHEMIWIPCKKVIWLMDIENRERGRIMEGLGVAFANNSTNGNISALHDEIEGVGMGSFFLDGVRSRL